MATDAQTRYITNLWNDLRAILPTMRELDPAEIAGLTGHRGGQASQLIDGLKASLADQRAKNTTVTAPAKAAPPAGTPARGARTTDAEWMKRIPKGTYALRVADDNGELVPDTYRFFKVGHGRVRLFLDETNGKRGDDRELYYVDAAERHQILTEIAADILGNAARVGLVENWCGICGKELTVKESIDRGIGPVCWDKIGGSF